MLTMLLLAVGCMPAPTPFPVTPIRTQEVTTTPGAVRTGTPLPPLRYGVLPNAADYIPPEALEHPAASVSVLDANSDQASYNVLVGFGLYAGWQRAPVQPPPVTLQLSTTRPPLDDPRTRQALRDLLRLPDILGAIGIPGVSPSYTPTTPPTEARRILANLGYPDGFRLYGWVVPAPGTANIIDQLATAGIRFIPVPPGTNGAHIVLGSVESVGSDEWEQTDLYPLPISYAVDDDVSLTFTDEGWPLASP